MQQTSRTICAICYEDANPSCEDLQAIAVCGHVFHELCLQQWLEYCPHGRKPTCPVCKQNCSRTDAHRLFFQSSSEISQAFCPSKNFTQPDKESIEFFQVKVQKLEGQLAVANSALLAHQDQQNELTAKLENMKGVLEKAAAARRECVRENKHYKEMLFITQEELERSSLECSNLFEQNTALSKELAALKLIADVNLEEDDALRLATIGRGANKDDVIDTLIKSLILRNRTYKELMSKCNELGRNENIANRKSAKTTEQLKRSRVRIQELEKVLEEKENRTIRLIRNSAKHVMQTRRPLGLKNGGYDPASELHLGANGSDVQGIGLKPFACKSVESVKEAVSNTLYSMGIEASKTEQCLLAVADPLSCQESDESKLSVSQLKTMSDSTSCGEDGDLVNRTSTWSCSTEAVVALRDLECNNLETCLPASVYGGISSPSTSFNSEGQVNTVRTYDSLVPTSVEETNSEPWDGCVMAVACPPGISLSCGQDTLPVPIRREAGLVQGLLEDRQTFSGNSAMMREGGTECLIGTNLGSWCNQGQMHTKRRLHSAESVWNNQHSQNLCGDMVKGLKSTNRTGTYIVTGANGRGGQIKVLKPPQSMVVSNLAASGMTKLKWRKDNFLKRSKKNPQATLRLEHFFCHNTPTFGLLQSIHDCMTTSSAIAWD
ncbi:hypothetical protein O6H91_01G129400 [Diphasiastrum complanatum]|uniref:Uncharacterized protein n=1 Tax=Diphasiastrum complanatum TaxID=34168 RepID=A0ACC2EW01_DIPCM|nr:hypothetical protein O6H91_01G129400 [Diphasiastrum complanatum]